MAGRKVRWAVGLAAVALAGCSALGPGSGAPSSPAPAPAPPPIGASTAPVGSTCNAQPAQWAVGKTATGAVVEQARVRANARMARVLRPGQAVTLEFDAERLSLRVDASGKVTAATCG